MIGVCVSRLASVSPCACVCVCVCDRYMAGSTIAKLSGGINSSSSSGERGRGRERYICTMAVCRVVSEEDQICQSTSISVGTRQEEERHQTAQNERSISIDRLFVPPTLFVSTDLDSWPFDSTRLDSIRFDSTQLAAATSTRLFESAHPTTIRTRILMCVEIVFLVRLDDCFVPVFLSLFSPFLFPFPLAFFDWRRPTPTRERKKGAISKRIRSYDTNNTRIVQYTQQQISVGLVRREHSNWIKENHFKLCVLRRKRRFSIHFFTSLCSNKYQQEGMKIIRKGC